jgi:hypothetical protein
LPVDIFDVMPPSARVAGAPGDMSVRQTACRTLPTADVRRRIVEVATQEWAYFGFTLVDQTIPELSVRPGGATVDAGPRTRRRWPTLSADEAARVADSIGGYWSATPEGGWILDAQNEIWTRPRGIAARWRYPWSAAFVSWVMCEGGLGDTERFRRAVAHHVYIDQAIRARTAARPQSAFVAYEIGETSISPGDLLCSARRPAYDSIAARRRQMGDGARTHCDIVVKVDESRARILAIGGNVRGTVSLKLLPAAPQPGTGLRPLDGRRPLFVHLKLRAEPIEDDALDRTPTVEVLVCGEPNAAPAWQAARGLVSARPASRC